MRETILKYALAYAGAGLPIFPLFQKRPATRHGFKDATTNLQQVEQWWHENPNYNIGLPVPSPCLVIDIDPRAGGAQGLAQLENHYGALPDTTACITGRGDGGKHYYFKKPTGRLTDRNLPDGIDIRVGERHYVVAPPSIHPDTGGYYTWTGPEHIADCPEWLADLVSVPTAVPQPPSDAPPEDLTDSGIVRFVAGLQSGQRNQGLFWAFCEALKDGVYQHIKDDIIQAARSIGLPDHEIHATAASAERRMSNS